MDVKMVNIIHEHLLSCFTFIVYNIFRILVMNRDNRVRFYLKELRTVGISTTDSCNVFIGISGYFMGNNFFSLKLFNVCYAHYSILLTIYPFPFTLNSVLFFYCLASNQRHFGVQMRNEKHHITVSGYRRYWVFIATKYA